MILVEAATPFIQSPLAVTLIGVACVTMVTLAGAAVKIVIQLARVEVALKRVSDEIITLKSDPDVMRWSNYGRATQALLVPQQNQGATS